MVKKTALVFGVLAASTICAFSFFVPKPNEIKPNYTPQFQRYLDTADKSIYGENIPLMYATNQSNLKTATTDQSSYYCLRDYYQIYTEDQSSFGLCWAFASTTSLETYLAINYNEFYNFSPAWSGLTTKLYWDQPENKVRYQSLYDGNIYSLGSGGNLNYFENAAKEYGLMLESDFPYANFYTVDDENMHEIYEQLQSKTINLNIDFDYTYYVKNNSTDSSWQNTLKNHIVENGSLYCGIKTGAGSDRHTRYIYTTSGNTVSNHAVSVIGWDDNYREPGWEKPGAWIALNSWGDDWSNDSASTINDDGILYVSYYDIIANEMMSGICDKENSSQQDELFLGITNSSSNIQNKLVNKYKYMNSTISSNTFRQKNIFEEGNPIEIEYSYNLPVDKQDITVNISKNGEPVNVLFNEISINDSTRTIHICAESLSAGTYKLEFQLNSEEFVKTIVVTNGLEIGSITASSSAMSKISTTHNYQYFYSNFNSFNSENLYFELYNGTSNHAYLSIALPTYSKVSECTYTNMTTSVTRTVSSAMFVPSSALRYADGNLYVSSNYFVEQPLLTKFTIKITLKRADGLAKNIFVTVFNNTLTTQSNLKYTTLLTDYNGATGNATLPKEKAIFVGQKNYIATPTKTFSTFDGWFTSPTFEESSRLQSDSNGYYITSNNVLVSQGSNYVIENTKSTNIHFYYLPLFAKWSKQKIQITYEWLDINGAKQTETDNIEIGNLTEIEIRHISTLEQPGYNFIWRSSNTNIDFETGVLKSLDQNVRIYGEYVLESPTFSSTSADGKNSTSISSTYKKGDSHVLQTVASHSASNVSLIYTWRKRNQNNIYEILPGKTSPSLTLSKASDSGTYLCQVKAKNIALQKESGLVYSKTFSVDIKKATATINTSQVVREITYDGTNHIIEGASLNHDETRLIYENNIIQNVGTGQKTVIIKANESENYTSATAEVKVNVYKAKITIKIDNKKGAVFAKLQNFSYSLQYGKIYNNDKLDLIYKSNLSTVLPGDYKITALVGNGNYDVEILDGVYTVYIEGLSLVLLVGGITVGLSLAGLLCFFILKKRYNDKHLFNNYFDNDLKF